MDQDLKFPTQEQIEERADVIINGIGHPHLPALPGITFRRLTLAERGEASRAYSRHLKEDMTAGGRFSEMLLPTELRRRCREVGLDYDELMAAEEEFTRRIVDRAPAELRDPAGRLSDDEIAAMPAEAREQYLAELRERGQAILEFLGTLFAPEEQVARAQIAQVKALRDHLMLNTYEHHARVRRQMTEILAGAVGSDGKSYFPSLDALYDLEDTDHATWLKLAAKWREFKEGRWPGFTPRSSSTPSPGVM